MILNRERSLSKEYPQAEKNLYRVEAEDKDAEPVMQVSRC